MIGKHLSQLSNRRKYNKHWQTYFTLSQNRSCQTKKPQNINAVVVGPTVVGHNMKTVISLDMQLYGNAKQLEMARHDCQGKWVLQIGEPYTVMVALRAV